MEKKLHAYWFNVFYMLKGGKNWTNYTPAKRTSKVRQNEWKTNIIKLQCYWYSPRKRQRRIWPHLMSLSMKLECKWPKSEGIQGKPKTTILRLDFASETPYRPKKLNPTAEPVIRYASSLNGFCLRKEASTSTGRAPMLQIPNLLMMSYCSLTYFLLATLKPPAEWIGT